MFDMTDFVLCDVDLIANPVKQSDCLCFEEVVLSDDSL